MNVAFFTVAHLESGGGGVVVTSQSGKRFFVVLGCPGAHLLQQNSSVGVYFEGSVLFRAPEKGSTRTPQPLVEKVIPFATGRTLYDRLQVC